MFPPKRYFVCIAESVAFSLKVWIKITNDVKRKVKIVLFRCNEVLQIGKSMGLDFLTRSGFLPLGIAWEIEAGLAVGNWRSQVVISVTSPLKSSGQETNWHSSIFPLADLGCDISAQQQISKAQKRMLTLFLTLLQPCWLLFHQRNNNNYFTSMDPDWLKNPCLDCLCSLQRWAATVGSHSVLETEIYPLQHFIRRAESFQNRV